MLSSSHPNPPQFCRTMGLDGCYTRVPGDRVPGMAPPTVFQTTETSVITAERPPGTSPILVLPNPGAGSCFLSSLRKALTWFPRRICPSLLPASGEGIPVRQPKCLGRRRGNTQRGGGPEGGTSLKRVGHWGAEGKGWEMRVEKLLQGRF